jgi:hypothetical protein
MLITRHTAQRGGVEETVDYLNTWRHIYAGNKGKIQSASMFRCTHISYLTIIFYLNITTSVLSKLRPNSKHYPFMSLAVSSA